jgi:glycosyltransferase involved in cell wall biosynthesis
VLNIQVRIGPTVGAPLHIGIFLIDVILPTFNRSHLIDRAINSVLAQGFQGFRLFVINDGSTDETETILQKYSHHSQIHFLRQENKGVSAARNLGIRHAEAEWIAFLDSDDEWLPQKLEKQLAFIAQNPHYRFVHSNEIWIRHGSRVNAPKKFDKSNHEIFKRSLETCLISPSTVMMKRELCLEHGCFDESFTICEDYDLWLKILAREEVGFISHELIKKYGGHDDQLSTRYHSMEFWRIKALVHLLYRTELSEEQKILVNEQINKKATLLKSGYLKHQNQQGLNDLLNILGGP